MKDLCNKKFCENGLYELIVATVRIGSYNYRMPIESEGEGKRFPRNFLVKKIHGGLTNLEDEKVLDILGGIELDFPVFKYLLIADLRDTPRELEQYRGRGVGLSRSRQIYTSNGFAKVSDVIMSPRTRGFRGASLALSYGQNRGFEAIFVKSGSADLYVPFFSHEAGNGGIAVSKDGQSFSFSKDSLGIFLHPTSHYWTRIGQEISYRRVRFPVY